jgi:hypothetical protein
MAINVAAKLTLNARGFLTGLASSEKAVAKFARFAGKELAGGAISMAGGTAAQSIFSRLGGGAKKVANEVPGVPTISAVANTIQPVIDPMGVKRKMGLALAAAGGAAAFLGTKGVQAIEEVKDLAEQTGLTTSEVQKLTKAAPSSGLEFGNFQTALSAGTATRKEAVESSEKLRKVYEALGITVKDLNNPLKTQLDLMRQATQNGDTNSVAFRTAFRQAFGRGSEKLISPLANMENQTGPIISQRSVEAVDRLAKAFEKVRSAMMATFGETTGAMIDKILAKFDDKDSRVSKLLQVGRALAQAAVAGAQKLLGVDPGMDVPPEFVGPLGRDQRREGDMISLGGEEALFEDGIQREEDQKVKELSEQIRDANLRAMPTEERRLALARDRLEIEQEIAALREGDARQSDVMALELKRAQIDAEIAGLDRQKSSVDAYSERNGDELRKVGGFTAGTESGVFSVWQQIQIHTAEIADNTRELKSGEGW